MQGQDLKTVELRIGSLEFQYEHLFLVDSTITADEVRQKYNKCVDALKKEKVDKPFHTEDDFIIEYLEKEYGWKQVKSDFVIHDAHETYGKIQNQEFNKVYLEEK